MTHPMTRLLFNEDSKKTGLTPVVIYCTYAMNEKIRTNYYNMLNLELEIFCSVIFSPSTTAPIILLSLYLQVSHFRAHFVQPTVTQKKLLQVKTAYPYQLNKQSLQLTFFVGLAVPS